MRKVIVAIASLSLVLAVGPAVGYPYISSDFNGSPVGATPSGWLIAGLSAPIRTCTVVDAATEWPDPPGPPAPVDIVRCVKFYDANGDTTNISFRRWIPPTSEGTTTIRFDVRFSQTTANFWVRVTNGESFTNLAYAVCQLQFEGNVPWTNGATGPGTISYLRTRAALLLSPSGYTYQADTWYTCQIELTYDALPENRTMTCYFGPKGGTPDKILDAVPWTFKNSDFPNGMMDSLQQVTFFTCNKTGGDPPEGEETVYLDNITIDGPVAPADYATIGEARQAAKGTLLRVTDRIVTAGSDEFGQFFYMQDNHSGTPGIRVRADQLIHEGDIVDVWGQIAQGSEGGIATNHNCEREIVANSVVVKSSDNPVPAPVFVLCKNLGGGWLGPYETVGVNEPMLKGVYPFNTIGDTTFSELTNSFCPLFNVGTLVAVVGKVTQWCGDYPETPTGLKSNDYYIWDTSNMAETSLQAAKYPDYDGWHVVDVLADPPQTLISEYGHPAGVRLRISSAVFAELPALNVGDTIAAIGISGAMSNSEIVGSQKPRNIRVLRIRKASDVILVDDVPPP